MIFFLTHVKRSSYLMLNMENCQNIFYLNAFKNCIYFYDDKAEFSASLLVFGVILCFRIHSNLLI